MTYRRKHHQKFSLMYRIEKWFYEDSVNHTIALFRGIAGMILCAALFGSVVLLPALFH